MAELTVPTSEALRDRLEAARIFLDLDNKAVELEDLRAQAASPGLWDDTDKARDLTQKLARYEGLFEMVNELEQAIEDAEVLAELALPVAGLLTDAPLDEVAAAVARAVRDEGVSAVEKFIPIFQDLLAWEAERMTDYADFEPRRAAIVEMYLREPLRASPWACCWQRSSRARSRGCSTV